MHIVREKENGTRTGPHEGEGPLSAPLKLIGAKAVETYCVDLNINP